MLRVRCRQCGTSFLSGHRGRVDGLRADAGLELREDCPHCGSVGDYRAAEYTFGLLVGPCGSLQPSRRSHTAQA